MNTTEWIQLATLIIVLIYTFVTYRLLSAQNKQGFENKFFQLLQLHHQIVNSLEKYVVNLPVRGRRNFEDLYAEYVRVCDAEYQKNPNANAIDVIEKSWIAFFNPNEPKLGHYFRNLYNIVKFVDRSNISDKKFYTNLIRAQLSVPELMLLFYDALSSLGNEKFKPLIEKYTILKNIPKNKLASSIHNHKGDHSALYSGIAYRK